MKSEYLEEIEGDMEKSSSLRFIALIIALFTIGYLSLKPAVVNPVASLRSE